MLFGLFFFFCLFLRLEVYDVGGGRCATLSSSTRSTRSSRDQRRDRSRWPSSQRVSIDGLKRGEFRGGGAVAALRGSETAQQDDRDSPAVSDVPRLHRRGHHGDRQSWAQQGAKNSSLISFGVQFAAVAGEVNFGRRRRRRGGAFPSFRLILVPPIGCVNVRAARSWGGRPQPRGWWQPWAAAGEPAPEKAC